MKPKILMAVTPVQRDEIFSETSLRELESFADVTYHSRNEGMTQEELRGKIPDYEGLITCWGSPRVTPEALEKAPKLRIISHSAGSVRSLICREVFERGICVTNASSAIAVSVAETTIGLVICSLRHLIQYNDHLRMLKAGRPDFGPVHELGGMTVGIVGLGEVGRRVANLLKAFGCRIMAYDPYKSREEVEERGCIAVTLEDLMSSSNIISIHAANIPKNRHMIDRDLLGRLPDGALVVNTARGELMDEGSLVKEVRSGRIACALDVFEADQMEMAAKLQGLGNVILTPHIAGQGVETRRRQGEVVVEDLRLFFKGERPKNLVSSQMMEWMA